jgi:hypothetical protein
MGSESIGSLLSSSGGLGVVWSRRCQSRWSRLSRTIKRQIINGQKKKERIAKPSVENTPEILYSPSARLVVASQRIICIKLPSMMKVSRIDQAILTPRELFLELNV